jgi:hypothetical protein
MFVKFKRSQYFLKSDFLERFGSLIYDIVVALINAEEQHSALRYFGILADALLSQLVSQM